MRPIKATFQPAILRLLEIRYVCDLTRAGGEAIPLGVLADLWVDGMYGLGLVARQALSPVEREKIGSLVRADFAEPFTYLQSIFRSVFDADAPPQAFAALCDRHTHSLRFDSLSEKRISLPRPLVTAAAIDARKIWVKDQLLAAGNEAYWRMFPDYVPDVVEKSDGEEVRELKKAA
jgi:hypothetical protein